MPRQSRIDAPGALHHVIVRGIERKAIFWDDTDRQDFLDRLAEILPRTSTACYAWALMPNHVHLLFRTGEKPIADVMRRLLTGYAVRFNRRHRRHGHLFQNRYKSILCQEEPYFKQLVAYIHLNPFRSGSVKTLKELQTNPYTGHGALMEKRDVPWQDTAYVLAMFGKRMSDARKGYAEYVLKRSVEGKRTDLTGGGLIRSAGGWRKVREAYEEGVRLTSDERILGASDFVEQTLARVGEEYHRKRKRQYSGIDIDGITDIVADHFGIHCRELSGPSRRKPVCQARAVVSYLAVIELQHTGADLARRMQVDRSSISRAIARVQATVELKNTAKSLLQKLESATTSEDTQQ